MISVNDGLLTILSRLHVVRFSKPSKLVSKGLSMIFNRSPTVLSDHSIFKFVISSPLMVKVPVISAHSQLSTSLCEFNVTSPSQITFDMQGIKLSTKDFLINNSDNVFLAGSFDTNGETGLGSDTDIVLLSSDLAPDYLPDNRLSKMMVSQRGTDIN